MLGPAARSAGSASARGGWLSGAHVSPCLVWFCPRDIWHRLSSRVRTQMSGPGCRAGLRRAPRATGQELLSLLLGADTRVCVSDPPRSLVRLGLVCAIKVCVRVCSHTCTLTQPHMHIPCAHPHTCTYLHTPTLTYTYSYTLTHSHKPTPPQTPTHTHMYTPPLTHTPDRTPASFA